MKNQSNNFIPAASVAIQDENLQAAVSFGTNIGFSKRQAAMFADGQAHGELIRRQAAAIKRSTLNRLPELLEMAEAAMRANGIQVLWAVDGDAANQFVLDIAAQHQVEAVVKSKSMVTEETGLNEALEAHDIRVLETDLGEYIVQLSEDKPSHIVVPIVHKTKESIRDTLIEKADMPTTDETDEMAHFARSRLREEFLKADMGVSGGNFIIAETGSLALVTNEGNARLTSSLPRVHVALVGIEKVIATVEDYATLTQVLPRSATGQALTVYTHLVNGPRRRDEADGPEHVYVIFVDNGRSDIYASDYAEALACIRCGACLNACPVYRVTGGHTYGWVYPGPIGAVITPLLTGLENATPLPYASSLCGLCQEVCPVDIDLPRMLLDLRRDLVESGQSETIWNLGMKAWAIGVNSPTGFSLGGKILGAIPNQLMPKRLPGPLSGWTDYRETPSFARKSFRHMWQDRDAHHGGSDEQS